jgi:hypothetical protein
MGDQQSWSKVLVPGGSEGFATLAWPNDPGRATLLPEPQATGQARTHDQPLSACKR